MNNFISGLMMGIGIALIFRKFRSITYHLRMLIRGIKRIFKL